MDSFDGMAKAAAIFLWIVGISALIFVPLGTWKLIELLVWGWNRLHIVVR